MGRNTYALAAAAMAVGLAASACSSSNSGTTTSTAATNATSSASQAATTPSPSPASPGASSSLQSLIPTPANTQPTDGPDSIADNGIHLHFFVNGSPKDVLAAYKTALEGKDWTVTVLSSGSGGDGGGATYTATQGDTYGVFSGGGAG